MRPKWLGVALVAAAVAAIVVYKGVARGQRGAPAAVSAAHGSPAVVLIADAREADEACGCGRIIRAVRAAGKAGVAYVEADPGSPTARAYHITVSPTVLFLGKGGAVRVRYQGESAATVKAIKHELGKLARPASGRR